MAALLRILLSRFGVLLTELLRHFGGLFVRAYVWWTATKIGFFMIKLGIFIGLLSALITGIESLFSSISTSMPPMLAEGITRVLPDNFYACVSAVLMAKFLVFTFQVKDRVLNLNGSI